MERLDKILANSGLGTRKTVRGIIKSGEVSVNGKTVTVPDVKIDENNDVLKVYGEEILYKKFTYLMLNKPEGYVSATEDNVYPTVVELAGEKYAHLKLFPVGRLDIDTEGLLILTNDGKFAHNVTSPKRHVPKKYFVVPRDRVCEEDKKKFAQKMNLGDFVTEPAELEISDYGCFLTIYEGKFHQVKRMFEKIGNEVLFLKRVKIGGLELDSELEKGRVRELSEGEIEKIWI